MTNRTPARDRPGAVGRRRGSWYRRSRVMPAEGRDLSSRRTQHVVRDLEIGEPINSEECSETAEGVARESEGRSRLSFLRSVRQDQPRGHPGPRLCPVPLQQGRAGCGWTGFREGQFDFLGYTFGRLYSARNRKGVSGVPAIEEEPQAHGRER